MLVDADSLLYAAPLGRLVVGFATPIERLLDAFQTGRQVAPSAYRSVAEARAELDRPQFLDLLASEWIAAVPEIPRRLQAEPPARVAIVASGTAWPAIAIARAFPNAIVDCFGIEIGRPYAHADEQDVGDRVRLLLRDVAEPLTGRYQLIAIVGALHELTSPVDALETMRRALAEDGVVLVMDAAVDSFGVPGLQAERFFYQCSVLFHLPVLVGEELCTSPETLLRPETLRHYARESGFSGVDVVPIRRHRLYRLYRLIP